MAKRSFYVKDSELDDYQVKVINKKTDNSYIVKGCAGSGKSILALWKAKQIQDEHKGTFLYVVYTKSLRQYMNDGIMQVGLPARNVVNYDACFSWGKDQFGSFVRGGWKMGNYDYIILDEAQDFSREDIDILKSKVENLSMLFSTEEVQTKALNEVTFEIGKGEFVAIMGPSGCGKSTLLNILGTLDTPTSGSYLFEGKRVDKMNENQLTALRKGSIGFIFQSFNLIDELTVYENIELPLVYLNIKPAERNRRVKEVLEKVNMLHRANHLPQQLSGGQQQRVAIARAVVTNARLLLADEPTGNLDSTNGVEVMELLSTLNKQGTTIIIVTHSQRDAAYAHRIIRLLDGKIIAENRNRPMESDTKIEIL